MRLAVHRIHDCDAAAKAVAGYSKLPNAGKTGRHPSFYRKTTVFEPLRNTRRST